MDVACPARGWQKAKLRQSQFGLKECLEKAVGLVARYPYRKPTQVGRHKCAKVYERMLVKELGKTASVS